MGEGPILSVIHIVIIDTMTMLTLISGRISV